MMLAPSSFFHSNRHIDTAMEDAKLPLHLVTSTFDSEMNGPLFLSVVQGGDIQLQSKPSLHSPRSYQTRKRRRNQFWHFLVSRSCYSASSNAMILVNKSLDKSYHRFIQEDLSILLVVFQSIIALVCLESCRRSLHHDPAMSSFVPNANDSHMAMGIWFCGMLVTGMAALHTNSLSMMIVSRNIANFLSMIAEAIWMKRTRCNQNRVAWYSLLLVGALGAAWRSHSPITHKSLSWMMAHCLCTTAYVVSMKQCVATSTANSGDRNHGMAVSSGFHPWQFPLLNILCVNHVGCILLLLPTAYMMGEIQLFVSTSAIHTAEYATKMLLAGFVGCFFHGALMHVATTPMEPPLKSQRNPPPLLLVL